jgi:hypothetical protein
MKSMYYYYVVVNEIEAGNYQSLGDYGPFKYVFSFYTMEEFMKARTPRRKYWWWGHIY